MLEFYDLNQEATLGMIINEECSNIEEALSDDFMLFMAGVSFQSNSIRSS